MRKGGLLLAMRRGGAWRHVFVRALKRGELAEAIAALDGEKTSHAETPRQAVKLEAARMLEGHFGAGTGALYEAGRAFARSESEGAQEVGLVLLGRLFAHNPEEVTETMLALADSVNWEVREWAASALRRVICEDFDWILETVQAWAEHGSPNVRRAAAVASGSAAGGCTEEQCRRLLQVMTPLLEDGDPYVRKNMGAFAVGDGFLRAQPEMTPAWLGRASSHPRAQWNVAMALWVAEAAKHFGLLGDLLVKLAAEDRRVGRRAVYRAVLNLAKWVPEEVALLVERWKDDPGRRHVYDHVAGRL